MPGVAVVGQDQAGGIIQGGVQSFVTIDGKPVSCVGDAVAGHGNGAHASPKIAEGSSFVTINGIPITFAGKLATCGHAVTPGSPWVSVSN